MTPEEFVSIVENTGTCIDVKCNVCPVGPRRLERQPSLENIRQYAEEFKINFALRLL